MDEGILAAPVFSGDDVLDWFRTSDARKIAASRLRKHGLGREESLIDDLLGNAAVAVLLQMRRAGRLDVRSPGAYGNTVLGSLVRTMMRGCDVPLKWSGEIEAPPLESIDPSLGDEVRSAIETTTSAKTWLTSAALAYVVYLMHPEVVHPDAPTPRAGATADQARCWPALWYAGERDLFPGPRGDPGGRTRSRRIAETLGRIEAAFELIRRTNGEP